MKRVLAILLCASVALLASGCGAVRFHHAWSSFAGATGPGLEGRWKGEWQSDWNGHSGGLRCLATRQDDGRYRAWFYSTYASLLFFQYEMVLQVTGAEGATLCFAGEQDLGAAVGGLYRYEGTVAGERFHATYRAENGDHGKFEMRRFPAAGTGPDG